MGLTPVPDDQLATVVTTLEMTTRPPLRPLPSSPLRLFRWRQPGADAYRILFRRVGAPWLWFSRLVMDDATLLPIIRDPRIELYPVMDSMGIEIGFVELDFRQPSVGEISYFGLVPELTGRGHGRWLMAESLLRAWRPGIERLTVNTCTLDHPSALNFYRAQGFVPIRRTVETFADPRAAGLLPADVAPHIPLLTPRR